MSSPKNIKKLYAFAANLLVIRDLKRLALFCVKTPFLTPLSIKLYTALSFGAKSVLAVFRALMTVLTCERKALLRSFRFSLWISLFTAVGTFVFAFVFLSSAI